MITAVLSQHARVNLSYCQVGSTVGYLQYLHQQSEVQVLSLLCV